MTQIATCSLLAVATVFIGLWTLISVRGAYTRDKTTYTGT